jgi:uncharacterized protein with HEPN domain
MSKSELFVEDILRHINDIGEFITGMTSAEFLEDKKTKAAISLKLLVIGEAANRLPLTLKSKHPEVEWNKIIRSRNIIAHDYEVVDFIIIWKIVTVHIPELKEVMLKIRSEL